MISGAMCQQLGLLERQIAKDTSHRHKIFDTAVQGLIGDALRRIEQRKFTGYPLLCPNGWR
jgi:hypothetical protein